LSERSTIAAVPGPGSGPVTASSSGLLALRNVWKRFRSNGSETIALQDVNFVIEPGQFITLIGPSGCGKSTLFNIIAGLEEPDGDGSVLFQGQPQKHRDLLGKVSFMPQKDLLFPWRTVLDNAALALEVEGMPRRTARQKAAALFPEFGLQDFENHYPRQLSGGMRQRVALMRTFLFERELLLLDEPFGALDALTRSMMQRWLLEIWARHRRTVLFITHDIDEAIFLGDRVIVMSARPGTVRCDERVGLPRPRSSDVMLTPEFLDIKRRLLAVVEEESRKTFSARS
jgi:ABC-type nitrate/sulfonate/bicarbonate transport system ATPase subunit